MKNISQISTKNIYNQNKSNDIFNAIGFFKITSRVILLLLATNACLAAGTPFNKAPAREPAAILQASSVALPSNLEVCFSPDESCDTKLIKFIDSSTRTLDIAIYSITHTGISGAITAAHDRGVKVRMVVDRLQAKGRSSQTSALQAAGIEMMIGSFTGIMHNKFTIVDGKMLETGSYNYTANATKNNGENQIYLSDAAVISRYQQNFENMFSNGIQPASL